MSNKRLKKYLEARRKAGGSGPIRSDRKTDQDFPGYPGGLASENLITPETDSDRKIAAVDERDGEKRIEKNPGGRVREENSDGSANAFEGTERVGPEET
ncbi:MAG TPA: hypothetical protein VEB63_00945 [Chitinophagaceae bacterium]|nr:hypothetical protein [Chitinophagaceae bacterium]